MSTITYFGHSAFSLTSAKTGEVLVVDPYISGNPHCSTTVEDLKPVNVIAVSHGSFDHLGDAYEIVKRTGAHLIGGFDVEIDAQRKGLPKEKLTHVTYGHITQVGSFAVRALLAFHTSRFNYGDSFLTGQPLSFLLKSEDTTIWYGGDTCIFGDMKLYGELFKPDVVVIGIGGRLSRARAEMTLDEAALIVSWMNPKVVIPVHYHWESNDPEELTKLVAKAAPKVKVAALRPGETLKVGE